VRLAWPDHHFCMKMRAELMINAPAEDAWAVVGERFGEISEWASAITESAMDGLPTAGRVRTCQVAGFGPIRAGVIKERLTQFDPQAKTLSYEAAAGMPWVIAGAVSRWSVHAGQWLHCPDPRHPNVAASCPAAGPGPALADARRRPAGASRA
jgi:hypothetical protein